MPQTNPNTPTRRNVDTSLPAYLALANSLLLCSSISKTLAPGLRVGWIAPGRFRDQILQLKTNQTLACPTITQLAVAEFLEHGSYDAHLRKIRTFFASGIEHAIKTLGQLAEQSGV